MQATSPGAFTMIRIDHPFLFAITEKSSQLILIMGKLGKPVY